jgi:CRP-like cAMP-binding protein
MRQGLTVKREARVPGTNARVNALLGQLPENEWALMKDGREIEYGSIGREGMVGLQVALDAQPLRGRALCQLEGEAMRLPGARLLLRYAQGTINVVAQSATCNALHSVRERPARWLLMTRDRAGCDTFDLSQEFLSKMLGVRRAGVGHVAKHLRVLDGARLVAAACECYALIFAEYQRVLKCN